MKREMWPKRRLHAPHEKDVRAVVPMAVTAMTALVMAVACDNGVSASDDDPARSAASIERAEQAVVLCDELPLLVRNIGTKTSYTAKINAQANCETRAYDPMSTQLQIGTVAAGRGVRLVCVRPESPGSREQLEYDYYPAGGEHIRVVSTVGPQTFNNIERPERCG